MSESEVAKERIDWSSLIRKEDWVVVWVGFGLLALAASQIIPSIPSTNAWSTSIATSLKTQDIPSFVLLGLGLLAISSMAVKLMGGKLNECWKGFPLIFVLSIVAFIISKQQSVNYFGLEYVLWALLLGLIVSNVIGVPTWLKSAVRTEFYIKIGLVLLGAEILFPVIIKSGSVSMLQAFVAVIVTWYFCYFLAVKVGLSKSFASIMASGVSICGVSAAIAAGGAIKGDKKEISYTISMVLLTSVVMLVAEPLIAKMLGLPPSVAGAWIGGTIDTTGAVVAAGPLYGNVAMTVASIVKLAQNVLIGIAAFALAVYWTLKSGTSSEKPKLIDIWYRFPKFIVGFIVASLLFSFVLTPAIGERRVSSILSISKGLREWLFCMSFICIGLETRFRDLLEVGGKKAALVYIAAQTVNIVLVYFLAWILFGGIFFPSPL